MSVKESVAESTSSASAETEASSVSNPENSTGAKPAEETAEQQPESSSPTEPPAGETERDEPPPEAAQESPDTGTDQDKPSDESSATASEEDPAERRRRLLRLRSAVGESQAKAVPNVAPVGAPVPPTAAPAQSTAPPTGQSRRTPTQPSDAAPAPAPENTPGPESSGQSTTEAPSEAPPTAPPRKAEVGIPAKEELAADLEDEINAALSQAEQPVVAADQDVGETPSADAPPEKISEEELEKGTRLKGTVQSIHGDDVFVDLGFRAPGVVQLRQFEGQKQPEVGQTLNVVVDRVNAADGLIFVNIPRGRRKLAGNWDAVEVGQTVDCMVTKTNKGGLEVTVGSLRGFLPAGQIDFRFISDMEQFVGQKLTVQIIEANRKRRNLVVSRRAFLEIERKEREEVLWKDLALGQTFPGTVKTIKNYGAFVDIGGVDGFLHIGEISWTRINHPSDVLSEGQEIEVQVISLDPEKKRIGLGMRQLTENPWSNITEKYPKGHTVSGTVTRTANFGAFVELEPGVEGLVHISELDYKRVNQVTDVLNVGQQIDVQVLDVDPGRKRIGLSLKALKENPQAEDPAQAQESADPPPGSQQAEQKRSRPLLGGIGGDQDGAGGLFGDPKKFK